MTKAGKLVIAAWLAITAVGGETVSAAAFSVDDLRSPAGARLVQVSTQAGTGELGSKDGAAANASFRIPSGLVALPDGTLLLADSRNHEIRKQSGLTVGTFAGLFYTLDAKGFPVGGLLDGKSDLSLFQEPAGLTADASGNVYVADAGNHAIRKIDTRGNVTTIAGNGLIGSKDGLGKEAAFYRPQDVAVSKDGTLYVADTLNHVIRRIAPDGVVTTLNAVSTRVVEVTGGQAAPAGDFADGALKNAKFNEPSSIVIDAKGNLYVSDSGNQRIRYIDLQSGIVTTVAGGGSAQSVADLYVPGGFKDGDGAQARFNFPAGLALNDEGGLFIADSQNHAIRYLLNGQVTTLAGASSHRAGEHDGIEGYAELYKPTDVAVQADGTLAVADAFNNKIRRISPYRLPAEPVGAGGIKVALDDRWIAFESAPEITNGRTMVSVRAITEALGYTVSYDAANRAVQLTKDSETVELYVDRTGIKRTAGSGAPVSKAMDAAPYIKNGSTYVPVRFFAEEIGLDVQWDNVTRTAILRRRTATP